ncbi:carboxymuconolactone decarboxylase family protein, partial [Paenarthrobacter ureafaciens]|uniref:carboxymuconolactone decarboxylase family protein n=2 Tax=Micrococcaceae TaxID=1268 RepID=UPI002DBC4113
MTAPQQTRAQQLIGDFAPKLVELTDDVLFGDIWERAELSPRDRSLVTVASLVTNSSTDQLRGHLARARANGLTEAELKEAIVHLAFYAGWPKAMSAITVAREVFAGPRLEGSPSGWANDESPVCWRGFRGV